MIRKQTEEAYILCRYFASCQYTAIGADEPIRVNYLHHLREEHKLRHVRVEDDEVKHDGAVRLEQFDPVKNTAMLIGADRVLGLVNSSARVLLGAHGSVKVLHDGDSK